MIRNRPLITAANFLAIGGMGMSFGFYREVAGTAMGFIVMMSGFGGMFFCWLTAVVSQQTDVGFGFIVPMASAVLALSLFLIRYRSLMEGEKERRALV